MIYQVSFDEHGNGQKPYEVHALYDALRKAVPTHIFLMAHGWNNSPSEARDSYRSLVELVGKVAVRPEPYRPVVIGIVWPSKALSMRGIAASGLEEAAEPAISALDVYEVFPAWKSPDTYHADVRRMSELLSKPEQSATAEDLQEAFALMRKYSIDASDGAAGLLDEDTTAFDRPSEESAGLLQRAEGRLSPADLFRIFTFWQMKKRAGVVGAGGVRRLLEQVMNIAAPSPPIYCLFGHSFGCKLVLSAVAQPGRPPLPRPVDAVVLVQPAISAYAFSERVPGKSVSGGYRGALEQARVRGPIVITFTSEDFPLNWAYPAGSRLAGQTGELEAVSRWEAMGAVGARLADPAIVQPVPKMQPSTERYDFTPGRVYNVRGTAIHGHSKIQNAEVAWLIWNSIAAARGEPVAAQPVAAQPEAGPSEAVAGTVELASPRTEAAVARIESSPLISPAVLKALQHRGAQRKKVLKVVRESLPGSALDTAADRDLAETVRLGPFGAPTLRRTQELPGPGAPVKVGEGRNVPLSQQGVMERIVDDPDFLPAVFLELGAQRQKAIGRVVLTREYLGLMPGDGWGTGFLVSPTLALTNNHVIPSREFAAIVELEMNFQRDVRGRLAPSDVYQFDNGSSATFITDEGLDFTLIRVKPRAAEPSADGVEQRVTPGQRWGFVTLDYSAVLYSEGKQRVNIVQHAQGRPKEIVVNGNLLTKVFDRAVHYQADTEPGSSGSPVFNNSWQIIALHHAAGEQAPDGRWLSNEAIRIDRIIEHLRKVAPADVKTEMGL